jgi:DNA-binding NarL/FixJ family response regulator
MTVMAYDRKTRLDPPATRPVGAPRTPAPGRVFELRSVPMPPPERPSRVSQREAEVLRHIARGLSNAEIGAELFISDTTVKTHVTRLLQKLDLRDRAQAIVLAYQTGLFETGPT